MVGRAASAGAAGGPRHPGDARQRGPRTSASPHGGRVAPRRSARGRDDRRAGPRPAAPRPTRVRLERFIPHDELLPYVDAMVTNGGYGGVQQALAHGVPLVVAGNSEDKPEVAARVQWSGAGINLRTGKPSKAMVARAVRRVLTHSTYRRRARALRAEIEASDPLGDITRVLAQICRDGARANGSAADS
ncbi:MAG TPA: nucleotide disphospho-sugar-binding domain-containing protein [Acidimicrobiales bacterium]